METNKDFRENLSEKKRKQLTNPISIFDAIRTLPLFQIDIVRSFCESGAYIGAYPFLSRAPKGDGHAVMVIPGLGVNDLTTKMLRLFLQRCGYKVFGWELGINTRYDENVSLGLEQRLSNLFQEYGKISVIGQCFGGLYALKLAHANPDMVRSVITLGTSMSNPLNADRLRWLYKLMNGQKKLNDLDDNLSEITSDFPGKLSMPTTCIYAKTDGVIDWKNSLCSETGQSENINIFTSHFGMGHNPRMLWVIADRLSQKEGAWEAFKPSKGEEKLQHA